MSIAWSTGGRVAARLSWDICARWSSSLPNLTQKTNEARCRTNLTI